MVSIGANKDSALGGFVLHNTGVVIVWLFSSLKLLGLFYVEHKIKITQSK